MKKILLVIVFIVASISSYAGTADSLFQKGNEAYQKENYELAIACYQAIVEDGYEGAVLYYNLGNAYFKAKQNAEAILWYERALRLDPSNEDIKHNIAFANLQITDKIEVLPELFITRCWRSLSQSMTVTGWAIMAVAFVCLFALAIGTMVASRRRGISIAAFVVACVSLIIVVFSLVFASQEAKRYVNQPEAIVMQSVVNAKGAPNETGNTLFVIHAGLKVAVTDRVSNWMEIKLPNGEKGWIEASSVEII